MLTALGAGREQTWQGLIEGKSAIASLASFSAEPYSTKLAAELQAFDGGDTRAGRRLDRCHRMAIHAAAEALDDAAFPAATVDPERVAIVIGSSLGGTLGGQRYLRREVMDGRRLGRLVRDHPMHTLVEHLTRTFGFRGPRMVFSTACTASALALAYAAELLWSHRADAVLTGGVDPLAELSFAGFSSMSNTASVPCSPFGEALGLTLGEGAAMLVLEREDDAIARGVPRRARLLGFGLTTDAYHLTSGDPAAHQQARAARRALEMAAIGVTDIGYVNAHGTGTEGNDPIETRAIHRVLGAAATAVPVSSLKGAIGHTLGAAGAIEAAITALALQRQFVPPTANHAGRSRPGCDLDYVPHRGREATFDHALSLNFAFGGNNAALVLAAADAPLARGAPAPPPCMVVVTGLGIVSPIACGVEALRAALLSDAVGIAPIRRFDSRGLGATLAGEIPDLRPEQLTPADLRRSDRLGTMTICATDLALRDSGLPITAANQEGVGIVVGTANGPVASCRNYYHPIAAGRAARRNPAHFPNTVFNAGAGLAAIHLRVKGPNAVVSANQSSGLAAIGIGFDLIRRGVADMMLCGGADELDASVVAGFAAARRIAPHERATGGREVCAPFDLRRSGMVLGEGGVFLALERLDAAVARKATIYGEVIGWAGNADRPTYRGWDPSGEGLARCMEMALTEAALDPADIDLVAAAALSHPVHDEIEARALQRVFGPDGPPVMAMTARVGTSAATAPLAAAAALLGLRDGFLPAGVVRTMPDPACALDLIEGMPRPGRPQAALINAAGLGGSNYTLALRRWPASQQ